MNVTSLGRINQTTPGTPIPLTTNTQLRACKVFFQVIPGLTGKAYVGIPTMTKATYAGVVRVLVPTASTVAADQFVIVSEDGSDSIVLSQYAIDLDVTGEGLLVSYWTR